MADGSSQVEPVRGAAGNRGSAISTVRLLLATLVAGVMVVTLGAAATAQRQVVNDSNSDGKYGKWGEIRAMKVVHKKRRLKIVTKYAIPGDEHRFLVKVPGRKKWQFLITWYTDGPTSYLKRVYVQTRKQYNTSKDRCVLKTVKYDEHRMRFTVPRRCLKTKGKKPRWVKVRQVTVQYAAAAFSVDRTRWTRRLRAG